MTQAEIIERLEKAKWQVGSRLRVVDGDGDNIAAVFVDPDSPGEGQAHARLFAAAPGLFAACRKLVASKDVESTGLYNESALYEAWKAAVEGLDLVIGQGTP